MAKKIIAVDIDDVIADSTESLRLRVNEKHGASLRSEDYRVPDDYWGYYDRVWHSHGLKISLPDEEGEMEDDQSHVPLLAGAAVALTELSKRFKIILVTARNPSWEAATRKWLHDHFADEVVDVYFAANPSYGTGEKSKGELCKELGAEWLIDDNPHHCLSAFEEGINVILFGEYGWHHKAAEEFIRCKDWPAVVEYFDDKS